MPNEKIKIDRVLVDCFSYIYSLFRFNHSAKTPKNDMVTPQIFGALPFSL